MSNLKRQQHIKIMKLLTSLNPERLSEIDCYFGGGTAISLINDEFRVSVDVDFLCATNEGYAALRESVFENGLLTLFKDGKEPLLRRDIRADRDGVRAIVEIEGMPIKFEIVREVRIPLIPDISGNFSNIPVPLLSEESLFAEKLLANTDRGLDKAGLSKDMIDLIVMQNHWGAIPKTSIKSAWQAYGAAAGKAYKATFELLRNDHQHKEKCFRELGLSDKYITMINDYLSEPKNGDVVNLALADGFSPS